MNAPVPSASAALPVISLTPTESALFSQLKDFVLHRNLSGRVPCVMRVCGGWVRDKLLQKDNDDIDICIDTCSGQEFTSELKTWYDSRGASSLCSTVGVIKASSEKSKHLETAVVRITVTGQDVPAGTVVSLDFVQLRSETYADDSRVPVAKAATAEEDAMRRDFTINAMFYNIQNETVEDFTGCGIDDLRNGLIRTPIDPVCTLRDDPLRALRAIRFQGRFNFALHEHLVAALRDPEVKRKLSSIISRERIGEEISGMFRGASPVTSMLSIHSCSLIAEVFGCNEVLFPGRVWPQQWHLRSANLLRSLPLDCRDRQLIMAVLTLPLAEIDQETLDPALRGASLHNKKARNGGNGNAVAACIHDLLKWPSKDLDITHAVHQGFFALQKLCADESRAISQLSRSEIAFALRNIPSHLNEFACLAPVVGRVQASVDKVHLVEKWDELAVRIQEDDLGSICCEHCLIDGRQVQSLLGVQGNLIAQSIHLILQWQFNHKGCSKEDVLAEITANVDTYKAK